MKRKLLLVATVGVLLTTGLVLRKAGWLGARCGHPRPAGQSLSTAAALQYRHAHQRYGSMLHHLLRGN
jgi:hypothetical protein